MMFKQILEHQQEKLE